MSNQPYIPRETPVLREGGKISRAWDASFFQPLIATVDTLTPGRTFANNAAALAGGLLIGQVYKTATGELRIVV